MHEFKMNKMPISDYEYLKAVLLSNYLTCKGEK